MEIVDVCTKRKNHVQPCSANACPCKVRRYVQPSRMKSFAPEKVYTPTLDPFDASTTYHLSYLTMDKTAARYARSQPFRPAHGIEKLSGKFSYETTTNLSYKPIDGIVRPSPFLPKQKMTTSTGRMEDVTTFRNDYLPKYIEKTKMIIPCGSIRTSTGPIDDHTTAGLSYAYPGCIEPTPSFKPIRKYCPPSQPIPKDTTQKLSYQPFCVVKKEEYPWAKKPGYTRPQSAMCARTIYRESYIENPEPVTVKPVIPQQAENILSRGAEFASETVYKGSYLPHGSTERAAPIVPCGSISKSDAKMTSETINRLSYKPIWAEKRAPIFPQSRSMIGVGSIQKETTNRLDFAPKMAPPPQLIVPCDNITTSKVPLEQETTTGLSYMKPGAVEFIQSFKPIRKYCKPSNKLEDETINKLSYQQWPLQLRQELPWAHKGQYKPPKDRISSDTIYHMSYPAPGYYVKEDDCLSPTCPCATKRQAHQMPTPTLQTCSS